MAPSGQETPKIEVHALSPARREDFFRLHSEAQGCGWCRCVAWWHPTWQDWGQRTSEENLTLRQTLFAGGQDDGYLLYVDGQPAAWCQAGPRDRLQKLVLQFGLEPDPDAWALTCFLVAPAERGKGLARALLKEALLDIRGRGAHRVEAFPKRGAGADPLEQWMGPEGLFRSVGFEVRRDHPERPVLCLDF